MKHLPRGKGWLQGHQGKFISAIEKKEKKERETSLKVSCTARSSKATLLQTTLARNVGCSKTCALATLCIGTARQEERRICLVDHDFHLMRFPGSLNLPTRALNHHPSPLDRGRPSYLTAVEGFLVENRYSRHPFPSSMLKQNQSIANRSRAGSQITFNDP